MGIASFRYRQFLMAGLQVSVWVGLSTVAAVPTLAQSSSYTITDLGHQVFGTGFPSGSSYANSVSPIRINNAGQILCQANAVYTTQSLPVIWQGGSLSALPNFSGNAVAINDAGQVAGNGANGLEVWQGGVTTAVPAPPNTANSAGVYASGIDNHGDLIANAVYSAGTPFAPSTRQAFLYQNGQWSSIGTLGGTSSSATAISGNGVVAGSSSTASGQTHIFRFQNSQLTDLGALPGSQGQPGVTGVNDAGTVAGTFGTGYGGNSHAFINQNGQFRDLGTLVPSFSNYISSYAAGINSSGEVVGSAEFLPDNGNTHAFLYNNGQMADLNALIPSGLNWNLISASSINDQGQIVGYGTHNGNSEAFLLTPAPPVLSSLAFASPVPGGTVLSGTVTLSGITNSDVVVGLSSSDPVTVRVFRSVLIPAGSQSATFTLNTFRSHTTKTVTLQATLGTVVQTQDLTITGR